MNGTRPLWLETAHPPAHPARALIPHVDVAIVGGGLTGLTTALLLRERGRVVAVLEKDRVGLGESGRTTAHVTECIDARYRRVLRQYGIEGAKLAAAASRAAIEQIAAIVQRLQIDCDFRRVPGYLYTENRNKVAELKNEGAAALESGVACGWVEEIPLPFPTRGGIRFDNQAELHPGRYLAGLAHAIADCIFSGTHVLSIDANKVETDRGVITAGAVVDATNAPTGEFTSLWTKLRQMRTYVVAAPYDREPPQALFWDTATPYHYTRWHGGRLIAGGDDHKVGEPRVPELERYVRERYGELPVEHRWSGQIVESFDGLPMTGRWSDDLYVATAYAGQGTTFGTAAAMLLADLIHGQTNEWSSLFDPHRAGFDIRENLEFEVRRNLHPVTVTQPSELKAGQGAIVEIDGRRVAVSRDDSGALRGVDPKCRHLGCDVAWNAVERSWDCPCHGSRYSPEGEVLNSPATQPLERIDVGE
jgi:glycine/D-amino acid oxidase-like deaminating enzyme/nitrite reductase/ring-hydroxylating ferredoxin subunit